MILVEIRVPGISAASLLTGLPFFFLLPFLSAFLSPSSALVLLVERDGAWPGLGWGSSHFPCRPGAAQEPRQLWGWARPASPGPGGIGDVGAGGGLCGRKLEALWPLWAAWLVCRKSQSLHLGPGVDAHRRQLLLASP